MQLLRPGGLGLDFGNKAGLATLADIYVFAGSRDDKDDELRAEWACIAVQCDALLKLSGELPPAVVDDFALSISRIIQASYRAGALASCRESAALQSERARAGKKRKAEMRGRIIRRAILAVCQQQNVTPVASEKFATSIRSDVIEAAKNLGLQDADSGTSAPSIRRHVAALLKDTRMR